MLGVQVFAVFFSLFMAYLAYLNFKKKIISTFAFLLWESLWAAFIFVVLFPSLFDSLVGALHFYRLFDMLSVVAFAFLILLSFYTFIIASHNRKKIEKIVSWLAIEEHLSQKSDKQKEKKKQH